MLRAAIASAGITQDIGAQVTAVPRCMATILEEILRDQAADRCTRKCSIPAPSRRCWMKLGSCRNPAWPPRSLCRNGRGERDPIEAQSSSPRRRCPPTAIAYHSCTHQIEGYQGDNSPAFTFNATACSTPKWRRAVHASHHRMSIRPIDYDHSPQQQSDRLSPPSRIGIVPSQSAPWTADRSVPSP